MKKLLLLLTSLIIGAMAQAQFQIGHKTITYNDATRTGGFGSGGGAGRQIQCEIYYPATIAGDNTPISLGEFPIISFGHGFAMSWDAYANIWDEFVPKGYILILPRTEGGLIPGPSHLDFGKDLVIAGNRLETDCNSVGNFFNTHSNGKMAVMGHSMGGGASFLAAAEGNANFDVIIGLAPAETNPLASTSALNVTIPALVFSGSGDAVTPPVDHHQLIYDELPNSSCRHFVSIIGGAHCYFANSNFNCDFGEGTSGGAITIDRTEQHEIMFDLLNPYLAFYLKNECSEWTDFLNLLATDARIIAQNDCLYSLPTAPAITQSGTTLSVITSLNVQWVLNGTPIVGATNTSYNAGVNYGSYTVIVGDLVVCTATSNPFNYGLGGLIESSFDFSVSPNPSTGKFFINSNETKKQASLTDVQGNKLLDFDIQNETIIDLTSYANGTYFLRTESTIIRLVKF